MSAELGHSVTHKKHFLLVDVHGPWTESAEMIPSHIHEQLNFLEKWNMMISVAKADFRTHGLKTREVNVSICKLMSLITEH